MNYLLNIKINTKMVIYFSQTNDDEIIKYYEYSLNNVNTESISIYLKFQFSKPISELKILEKFKELNAKFKNLEGESKTEYQKLFSEMIVDIMIL